MLFGPCATKVSTRVCPLLFVLQEGIHNCRNELMKNSEFTGLLWFCQINRDMYVMCVCVCVCVCEGVSTLANIVLHIHKCTVHDYRTCRCVGGMFNSCPEHNCVA